MAASGGGGSPGGIANSHSSVFSDASKKTGLAVPESFAISDYDVRRVNLMGRSAASSTCQKRYKGTTEW